LTTEYPFGWVATKGPPNFVERGSFYQKTYQKWKRKPSKEPKGTVRTPQKPCKVEGEPKWQTRYPSQVESEEPIHRSSVGFSPGWGWGELHSVGTP